MAIIFRGFQGLAVIPWIQVIAFTWTSKNNTITVGALAWQ